MLEKDDSAKGKSYFSYDPMGRISQYINPENKVEEFLRDPAGDLIKQQDTTPGPESKPELYTRTSTHKDSTYTFDAVGNLIKRNNRSKEDLTTFTWDECNRLVRANRNGTVTEMLYDASGRRISKETNGEKTEFFWDGEQFFADRKDGKIREFIYYPGTFEPLAIVDGDRKIFYFNNDLVGLPQEVTTDTGEIVWSASYDAHGKVTKIHEDYFDNPLRLQGQYFDPEIDLCYNRYRYYDPDTGSFISADPLRLRAGTNNYAYAPNIWGWIDPMGLMTCPPKGGTYREVRKANTGGQVHHMPTKQSLKAGGHPAGAGSKAPDGPAIHMETPDHRALPSSRGSAEGRELIQRQTDLVRQGNVDDAFLLGVDEVQAIHGSKYDDAILQAIDALP